MIIKSVHVRNFRSIKDEILKCNNLTALLGANGTGKSSFLRALDLFYSKTPKVDIEDFYNRNTSENIEISITFSGLSEEAKKVFGKYIKNDELTVVRVFGFKNSKLEVHFHGSTLQNPDFSSIRELIENKKSAMAKQPYDDLRKNSRYSSLPSWTTIDAVKVAMEKWENDNSSLCKRTKDDGQFFGFNEVAEGFLGRFTRLIYIAAVRDAAVDSLDTKASAFDQIMELVIRTKLMENPEMQAFQKDTLDHYHKIMDPSKLTQLFDLSKAMTNTLKNFVPDAGIQLSWQALRDLEINPPKADVRLVEDSYQSTVARSGHGLQRAFIMTLLQHLSSAQVVKGPQNRTEGETTTTENFSLPDLLFVIEEPELYQHPDRQRHLAKVFQNLADGKLSRVAEKTQVIYSTHSPHFVTIEKFENIRLLRKVSSEEGRPKVTKIFETDLDEIANELSQLDSSLDRDTLTGVALLPRLHAIMSQWMNEGFFADVVVLVEGEEDRAILLGIAESQGHDLESMGYSVIPCVGKPNLDRPTVIFRKLGIPVYVLWDSDRDTEHADPLLNHKLLRMVWASTEDWPNKIEDTFACFETKLSDVLIHEIGEPQFENSLGRSGYRYGIQRKRAIKNPVILAEVVTENAKEGRSSPTLQKIINKILSLKYLKEATVPVT